MDANPYSAPQESTSSDATSQRKASRAIAAVLSALVGVPLGGVLAYLLFGFCYAIGSRVISDATYERYASSMFMYGSVAALLPSLLSGFLNSRAPIAVLLLSHFVGVLVGATVVSSGCRWYYAMGAYLLVVSLLPPLVSASRRAT